MFAETTGQGIHVQDPIGSAIENYRALADQIERILEGGLENLRKLAESQDEHP